MQGLADCLQLLVSCGVRACSLGTTPGAFALQRPSFNFLCTKDSRPKMVVFWNSMCFTTQQKGFKSFYDFILGVSF